MIFMKEIFFYGANKIRQSNSQFFIFYRLSNSNVLLLNLNCSITELAKNLILSGTNLILYDKDINKNPRLISERDVNSNFFMSVQDINKIRIKILKENLQNINSFVKIEEIDSFDNLNLNEIKCVCVGFTDWNETVK